jgi:hypothetical protein
MKLTDLQALESRIEKLAKMSDGFSKRELANARAQRASLYDLDPRPHFSPWSVTLSGVIPIEDEEEDPEALLPILHFFEENPRRWTQVRQLAERMPVEQCQKAKGICMAYGQELDGQRLLFGFVNHSTTAPHRTVRFIHASPCDAAKGGAA